MITLTIVLILIMAVVLAGIITVMALPTILDILVLGAAAIVIGRILKKNSK